MDRARLTELLARDRTVEHEGETYRLVLPAAQGMNDIHRSLAGRGAEPGDAMTQAMLRVIQRTLLLDGEDGPSLTEDEAGGVLVATGGYMSPVGRAALEMCGVRLRVDKEDSETPDEVPSS